MVLDFITAAVVVGGMSIAAYFTNYFLRREERLKDESRGMVYDAKLISEKEKLDLRLEIQEKDLKRSHQDHMREVNREKYYEQVEAVREAKKEERAKGAKTLKRSKEVMRGQAFEQITPYLEEFDYSPNDCRFLGSPIDMVVFDGATSDDIDKVVLVEIKTGNSRLNKRQRQIKKAVLEGRVEWEEFRIDTEPVEIKHKPKLAKKGECYCGKCVENYEPDTVEE